MLISKESACPVCGTTVKIAPHESGECPGCGAEYWWHEYWDAEGDHWELAWTNETDE